MPAELELPAIETPEDVADETPVEQPEGEQSDPAAEAATEGHEAAGEKGDGRLLPAYIRNMKESDPKAYREASQLFFKARTLDEKLTGVDLDKTLAYLTENGGLDGLQGTLQEREAKAVEYDTLLERIGKGDAAVVRELAESSPQAFPQIAQAAMQEWAGRDQESYSAALSGVFAATIAQGQTVALDGQTATTIPNLLSEARYALQYAPPEQQGQIAMAVMERVQKFLGSFSQTRQPSQIPSRQAKEGLEAERQTFEQEKQQTFNNDVATALDSTLDADVLKELGTYIARKPADEDAKALATANVKREVIEKLGQDKDFKAKYQQLLARKDKDGAMKLATSRQRAIMGAIAQRVGRTIYGNPTPAKPATATRQTVTPIRATTPRAADKFDAIWNS